MWKLICQYTEKRQNIKFSGRIDARSDARIKRLNVSLLHCNDEGGFIDDYVDEIRKGKWEK